MKMPLGFRIVTSSAWADTFRPSLDAHDSLPDGQDNFFVMHPRHRPQAHSAAGRSGSKSGLPLALVWTRSSV